MGAIWHAAVIMLGAAAFFWVIWLMAARESAAARASLWLERSSGLELQREVEMLREENKRLRAFRAVVMSASDACVVRGEGANDGG